MKVAFIDTSCLVAVAFAEPAGAPLVSRLESLDRVLASNVLEAEFRASLLREGLAPDHPMLNRITWVLPDRPLGREITAVLAGGHLRGADAWHLATALYLAGNPRELPFLTLDDRQFAVARRLGFPE